MVFIRQRFKIHPRNGIVSDISPAAGLNTAVVDGQRRVGDDQRGIDLQPVAETGAFGAGAHGVVEGEHTRRQLGHGNTAVLAGVVAGKERLRARVRALDNDKAACVRERGFHGVGEAACNIAAQDETVHDQLDGVLFVLFQRNFFAEII